MWEVIFRFVDIGGIADHHCLNFLFNSFCWHRPMVPPAINISLI